MGCPKVGGARKWVLELTCLKGLTGNLNVGRVAGLMFKTFSSLHITQLVSVGGGIPLAEPPDNPTEASWRRGYDPA